MKQEQIDEWIKERLGRVVGVVDAWDGKLAGYVDLATHEFLETRVLTEEEKAKKAADHEKWVEQLNAPFRKVSP